MISTHILIDIRCPNKSEIINCICDTLEFMPGWTITNDIKSMYGHHRRMYSFNLTSRVFSYWRNNETYSDTLDEDEVIINNLEDISTLLEFVYLNADRLEVEDTVAKPHSSYTNQYVAAMTNALNAIASSKSLIGQYNIDDIQAVFKTEMMKKMYEKIKSGDVNFVTQNEYKDEYECGVDNPVEPAVKWTPTKSSNEFHKYAKIWAKTKLNPDFYLEL